MQHYHVLIGRFSWVLAGIFGLIVLVTSEASASESLDRIEALRTEIARHDALYFQENASEITDYEYDLLKLELRRLEAAAGIPTEIDRVGDDLTRGADQIRHTEPMLSLDKAYSEAEVADFFDRVARIAPEGVVSFSLEPKFDGVAVNMVMERGELVSAATRGNGEVGEDITDQIEAIEALRYEWEFDATRPRIERIELRGEVFLHDSRFEELNAARSLAGQALFRHPRNVAAGSVKLTDLAEVASRGLSIVLHGWGAVHPIEATPQSVMDFQRWLERVGLPSVWQTRYVTVENSAELNHAVEAYRESFSGYPTDGMVIKVDSGVLQKELGHGPTAPRWALARKFRPTRVETVLRNIVWQVGRTGILTPVAEFDPVILSGSTIRRASLSHALEIERRDLRLGDAIWVEKAGEIIPQIVGVISHQREADAVPYVIPDTCPACGHELLKRSEGRELLCANFRCQEQRIKRLLHFVSNDALQIQGIGPAMARRLILTDTVDDPSDLYHLTTAQLVALPGIGDKTAQDLLIRIEASRARPLERWIVGLGLPGVGKGGAKALAVKIDGLRDLLDEPRRSVALEDFSSCTAEELSGYLDRREVREMIERLSGAARVP